ncbi:MAG TPA: hypothetical protein VK179_04020 [Bacteroidales bacterium]|nr:hypothetical protein [Bacteroidales bacterium]
MSEFQKASIRYKIYQDRNLLVDVIENHVRLEDLRDVFFSESSDPDFIHVHKALTNAVNADPGLSVNELQTLIPMLQLSDQKTGFRWAILTDKPKQTTMSMLIKKDPYFRHIIGVFTTLAACNSFLHLTFDESEFNDADYKKLV